MTNRLHITNGDGAGNVLKASTVEGDLLIWKDPMHHGPFPVGLALEEASRIRARYLAAGGLDEAAVIRDFEQRDAHLKRAAGYHEVILWFEHDLLDQLQIVQLLDGFAQSDTRPPELTLICIDRFDGIENFRGLGQLDPVQMASLLEHRRPVSDAQLALACDAWQAFRDPDPRTLEAFVLNADDALPFLRVSLKRQLQEFPWTADGLSRTERQILTLINQGIDRPGRLFMDNMDSETVLYIGDWNTYGHIAELCNGAAPLIRCEPEGRFRYPPNVQISRDDFRAQRLSLTPQGRQLLAGRLHGAEVLERDFWLGGVHLRTPDELWFWDQTEQRLER